MLTIRVARIVYPDGSVYEIPTDGTWAEAPPFGVQMVVYYHVPDLTKLTKDGGTGDGDVYVWLGEETGPEYEGLKMGLWMDAEGYYRVADLANARTRPEA